MRSRLVWKALDWFGLYACLCCVSAVSYACVAGTHLGAALAGAAVANLFKVPVVKAWHAVFHRPHHAPSTAPVAPIALPARAVVARPKAACDCVGAASCELCLARCP